MKLRSSIFYDQLVGNSAAFFLGIMFMSLSVYVNGDHYGIIDNPWPMLLGWFVWVFWTVRLHAYYEAYRIEIKHQIINHRKRFIVRSALAIAMSLIIHILAEGFTWTMVLRAGAGALYIGGIFWLVFDIALNFDRGKHPFYISRWYQSAKVDRFFRKLNSSFLWLLSKVVLFFLTAYLYFKVL